MTQSIDMLLFWGAFWCYLAGTVTASIYIGTRSGAVRRLTFVLTIAGLALNTAALVARGVQAGHPPIANLFEYLSLLAWASALGLLLVWRRKGLELLTILAAPLAFGLIVIASLFPTRIDQQLIPALQSHWLWIHVSLAVLGEAAFAVAFVASVLHLIRGDDGSSRLPSADALDRVTYRAIGIGFPLFTIGALFAGAVWAQRAWGSPWSWDPKETSSLIVWLIYAIYLHVRLVRGWRGTVPAIISIVGFAMTIFTIFGSMIFGGLHSYG
ncbi:MAG: c-type cytochrome biogenesis protein CcsB [Candidatus Eisenbacteria bacterium]|nr:c-type cytochrome biogenesis protein CcsB [Candidatus Eisenbacteria bacterium]